MKTHMRAKSRHMLKYFQCSRQRFPGSDSVLECHSDRLHAISADFGTFSQPAAIVLCTWLCTPSELGNLPPSVKTVK